MTAWLARLDLTQRLGYAGLIPFVLTTLGVLFGVAGSSELFKLYSVVILAFMAGATWGALQSQTQRASSVDLTLAIGTSLWALMAYLLPADVAVPLLVMGYALLLWLDMDGSISENYSTEYTELRKRLTIIVVALHVLVFIAL
ncbi:hypothetical protein CHH28_15575 [Bacterioplanes sanyensis]|uniref:DUF3429 domain-containing protein n=1 Tax=Bacterioplanes sanyensis TaxID=1249553 RepID=A0A222FN67_9GAMM|nr:DUF3429 domain-containing protein [Bacterioplanes sanyensis]ASP40006.1 hypothetical protein CHH28_15575 [Bacterioplanes sanyensis]